MRLSDLIAIIGIVLFGCASIGEPATWFAIAYVFFVISIALTSYGWQRSIAQQQAAKAKKNALKGTGYLMNYRDTQVPINMIYGTHKVGCNQIYIEVKDDHTLCFNVALGEGPIKGINRAHEDCVGIDVWFGEKHLHQFHGFNAKSPDSSGLFEEDTPGEDEFANFNYAVGSSNQDKLPVYSWDAIDHDQMHWTAHMGFRLHWDDSKDFDSLGGFPVITTLVHGLLVEDPRRVVGHEGMMWLYREHLYDRSTSAHCQFDKTTNNGEECFWGRVVSGLGCASLFHVFYRDWLHGKRIRIKWKAYQAGGVADTIEDVVRLYKVDGTLKRDCNDHFPEGQYRPLFKKRGTLGTLDTNGFDDPWHEDLFDIDCDDCFESNITIVLDCLDDSATKDLGWMVAWIKIENDDGLLLVYEDFDNADTMVQEKSGSKTDYGTWNASETAIMSPCWSDNPALVIYDIMRNERYGGAIPEAFFDLQSVIDAANWCDLKGYHCNLVVYEQDYLIDVVYSVASTFRMGVIFSGGLFKFLCFDYEVPAMTFTEQEIKTDSFRIIIPTASDVPTQVRMKFPNAGNYYSLEDYVLPGKDFIAAEGEVREKDIIATGLTDYHAAKKLACYQLERAYYCNQYYFVVGMKGYPLEAGDVVAVSHSVPGWPADAAHNLRLTNVQYMPQGEVALVGIPEEPSIYDDTINTVEAETYYTTLPGHAIDEQPDVIPDITIVSYTIEDTWQGGTKVPRVVFTFELPEYVQGANAWYSPDNVVWGLIGNGFTNTFFHFASYNSTHYYKLVTVMADNLTQELADAPVQTVIVGPPEGEQEFSAYEDLTAGNFVSVYVDATGATKVRKADKSSIETKCDGFVDASYVAGSAVAVRGPGNMNTNLDGLVTRQNYFLGSAGQPAIDPPTNDGEVNQLLGVAASQTSIFFIPGPPVIIHV